MSPRTINLQVGGQQSTIVMPQLFFNPMSRSQLALYPNKAYTHYFTQFVRSQSNTGVMSTEYAYRFWMPPGALEGTTNYATWGGWFRDYYKLRPPNPNPAPGWQIDDMVWEVNAARDACWDGFIVDQLSAGPTLSPTGQYIKYRRLMTAIEQVADPTFKFYAQPDGNASTAVSPTQLAADLAEVATHDYALFTPDGRLDVSPYGPEFAAAKSGMTAFNFWNTVKNTAEQSYATGLSFNMCYSKSWLAAVGGAPELNSISDGHGRWGLRNELELLQRINTNADAAQWCHDNYGKPWMGHVAVGDSRAKSATYHENHGFQTLRESWKVASGVLTGVKSDRVINPTWNDLGESAHTCPTENHGYVYCDLNAYYIHFYKTGIWPKKERDCVFISHRVQFMTGTTYTGPQTVFANKIGTTPLYEEVDFLVAAKGSCTLETTVGGSVTTYTITQADIDASWDKLVSIKVPLALGSISCRLIRNGVTVAAIASPFPVANVQVSQDPTYRTVSSLRGP